MSVKALQDALMNLPQVECPVAHHFSDGIYARELVIPEGVTLVGAKHKTNHLFLVAKGECMIGSEYVKAPMMTETKPGTKRAIHAITETVLYTFHVTDKKDIVEIGEEILEEENGKLTHWRDLK